MNDAVQWLEQSYSGWGIRAWDSMDGTDTTRAVNHEGQILPEYHLTGSVGIILPMIELRSDLNALCGCDECYDGPRND